MWRAKSTSRSGNPCPSTQKTFQHNIQFFEQTTRVHALRRSDIENVEKPLLGVATNSTVSIFSRMIDALQQRDGNERSFSAPSTLLH
jgi:hypothetical protein